MKSSGFVAIAAVSAIAALLAVSSLNGVTAPFALALLCIPAVGFFALETMGKAGLSTPGRELLFISASAAAYFFAAFSLSATAYLSAFAFAPLLLCVPAATGLALHFSSG